MILLLDPVFVAQFHRIFVHNIFFYCVIVIVKNQFELVLFSKVGFLPIDCKIFTISSWVGAGIRTKRHLDWIAGITLDVELAHKIILTDWKKCKIIINLSNF